MSLHNVLWMPIAQVNWPASVMFARILVTKPNHAVHMLHVALLIHCHYVPWYVNVIQDTLVMLILLANWVNNLHFK